MEVSTASTDRYLEITAHFGQTCYADMNTSIEASQFTGDMSNQTPGMTSTPRCTDIQHSWESVNVHKGNCRFERQEIGGNRRYSWSGVGGLAGVPHHFPSAKSRPKHVLDMSTFVRMEASQWLVKVDGMSQEETDLRDWELTRRREEGKALRFGNGLRCVWCENSDSDRPYTRIGHSKSCINALRTMWGPEAWYAASYHAQSWRNEFRSQYGRASTNSFIDRETKLLPFKIVSIDLQ